MKLEGLFIVGGELYADEDGIARSPETVELWTEEKADRVETYIDALPYSNESGIDIRPLMVALIAAARSGR